MENGHMRRFSPDLEIVNNRGSQTIGLRFDRLNIPHKARIGKAFIQFCRAESSSDTGYFILRAENTAYSRPFSSFPYDLSNRQPTSIVVSWSPRPWIEPGVFRPEQRTTDISSLIQPVVDLPDWSPGNALSIIINGAGVRIAKFFDGDPQAAPFLFVEYYEPVCSTHR